MKVYLIQSVIPVDEDKPRVHAIATSAIKAAEYAVELARDLNTDYAENGRPLLKLYGLQFSCDARGVINFTKETVLEESYVEIHGDVWTVSINQINTI